MLFSLLQKTPDPKKAPKKGVTKGYPLSKEELDRLDEAEKAAAERAEHWRELVAP